jgi:hypothetical protein
MRKRKIEEKEEAKDKDTTYGFAVLEDHGKGVEMALKMAVKSLSELKK